MTEQATAGRSMHSAKELLLKKRDGMALSADEIAAFVDGVCDLSVTDAQIAAFAMATWFRGMSTSEQRALTLAMRDSGQVLDWPELGGPVLDKHSTGGVGDMVSLILAPLMAACGAFVPMISGRGLGHTGGTLDKLASIPGLETALGIEAFQRIVRREGLAIVGQTAELAPADRRLYAVRDVTATVSSVPLIVSSILSKKLSEGLDGLVLDVKFGSGAVLTDPNEAHRLAREICRISKSAGVPARALVTDMDEPLAWSAGNALEVRETIRFLRGEARNPRLAEVAVELCIEMLQLGGLAQSPRDARVRLDEALDSGRAAERFAAMVCAQGGPAGLVDDPEAHLPVAQVIRPVPSREEGYVQHIDTRAVGMTVVRLGGGRERAEDSVDPAVGLSRLAGTGQRVGPDRPLAVVHAADESAFERAAAMLQSAFSIGSEPPASRPVIRGKVVLEESDEPTR